MTPLADLTALLDHAPSLPVPAAYEAEARLPGAMEAWRSGLDDELAVIQRVLFTPREGAPVSDAVTSMVAVNAAQRQALDDVETYTARFEREPLGRRLRYLARAELSSRAARLVNEALVA